jgi:hypothetical protein
MGLYIYIYILISAIYRIRVIDILLKVMGPDRGVHVQPPINNADRITGKLKIVTTG